MRREKLNYFVIQIIRKVYNPVISEAYIPHELKSIISAMVYNPVILRTYTPQRGYCVQPFQVYNPAISGFHTPDTGIFSSLKVLVSPLT